MAAFEAAVAAGHGIECDVCLSRDGVVFVFHDDRLDRLTGAQGRFAERSAAELDALPLRDGQPIPRLSAMLARVDGRVPLLIELKADSWKEARKLSRAVAAALAGYRGPFAVMSFHPGVGAWFARHAPQIVRGLVVTEEEAPKGLLGVIRRHLDMIWVRPDFLAYDICSLPSRFVARFRSRGLPVLSWTVRTQEERAKAARYVDAIIFEEEAGHG